MAGGTAATFEKANPYWKNWANSFCWWAKPGPGNSAKLAINTLLSFHAQGLAETVLFAQQNNIKTEDMLAIINNSALGNVFAKIKGDAILNDNYKAAFALKHIAKDLRLAKAEGLNSPLAKIAYQTFQEAEAKHGEEDIIAVIKQVGK
jgi:3-hydroxyisobutyrate dehydrogenase